MKNWLVKVAYFWSADHIEPIHTERKTEALAIKQLFVEVKEID